ncbi:MAG: NTPase [Verrucomicrobia bacterium]|nr:NTPase [Verrucomicrobiota bacterium]
MLKKLTEPEVTTEAPFANDALERKAAIEKLTNLVESTEQPFVLSIEAPWGWGKTTFIRMWKAYLESKGHVCLHFNAWENDFVDDPLVAFLGEMHRLVEKEMKELDAKEPVKVHWGEVKRIGAGVLRKALPLAVQLATQGLLSQETVKRAAGVLSEGADEVAEFASTLAKERLDKYESERTGIKDFRSNLEKLAEAIVKKEGLVSPLVFFIDEMDRCRPDFAIALLERIKHLFNVKRVVFVLAVDRAQLNQSVKTLYGLEMEPDGYLRRFIDLAYALPPPSPEKFAEALYCRFALEECFGHRPGTHDHARILVKGFWIYAQALGLSLRTQEQCFTEINLVLRTAPNICRFPAPLCFLVTLRAFRPEIFRNLREGRVDIDAALKWLSKVGDEWFRQFAEATLISGFLDDESRQKRLEALKQQAASGEGPTKQHAETVQKLLGVIWENWSFSNAALHIVSQLEMTSQFR